MKQTIQKILTDYIQILSDLYKLNYIYTKNSIYYNAVKLYANAV